MKRITILFLTLLVTLSITSCKAMHDSATVEKAPEAKATIFMGDKGQVTLKTNAPQPEAFNVDSTLNAKGAKACCTAKCEGYNVSCYAKPCSKCDGGCDCEDSFKMPSGPAEMQQH